MNLVQKPEQEFLSVVLTPALILTGVFLHEGLETDRDLGVVLERPQGLEKGGQLLRDLSFMTYSKREGKYFFSSRLQIGEKGGINLNTLFSLTCSLGEVGEARDPSFSFQIGFILVKNEVLGQNVSVTETLEDGVDEARVSVVPDSDDPGHLAFFQSLLPTVAVSRSVPEFDSVPRIELNLGHETVEKILDGLELRGIVGGGSVAVLGRVGFGLFGSLIVVVVSRLGWGGRRPGGAGGGERIPG